jgi:hypothetical protein
MPSFPSVHTPPLHAWKSVHEGCPLEISLTVYTIDSIRVYLIFCLLVSVFYGRERRMPRKSIPLLGGTVPMRRIGAVVPEDIYKALKIYAVEHDQEMQEVIIEALRRFLEKGDRRKE